MEEKTLVQAGHTLSEGTFLYREDYLLFGLLVRHGLCEPYAYSALVAAQREDPSRPSLMNLLSKRSALSDKARLGVQELLSILSTPKLRELLPGEMPELHTLVETLQATRPIIRGPQPDTVTAGETLKDRAAAPTLPDAHSLGSRPLPSYTTSLTYEERKRLDEARKKCKLVGETLSGHLIIDRLGSGGQGDVYLAKQLSLNRYVALKKLETPRGASAREFLDAFRREAQTLAQINHTRIVKVFEIFEEGGTAYFTMEHLNGRTLKELVHASGGPMPLDVVANLACQACSALARTASEGLVHRDIKPANMMLDENGDLKIVDFGLAGAAASFMGREVSFAGTPHFAAPEQAMLLPLTPATDQYSLGLTLYYALTGELPFKAAKLNDILEKQIREVPPPPSELNNLLPRSVDRVILRMIQKDPAARHSSFEECYEEWEKILHDSSKLKVAQSAQLLADTLLRFTRQEKDVLKRRGLLLAVAWILLTTGTVMAEFKLRAVGMGAVLDWSGRAGTYLLTFSLTCIFYVGAARKKWLPTIGSLRVWLYTHIVTAVISVVLLLLHSGNFIYGLMPGGVPGRPVLSVLLSFVLLVTAISGTVGLIIFRTLRRQLLLQELQLRGANADPRQQMLALLSAQFLSGWRLVHYPLAVFFILMALLHIYQSIRFGE